MCKTLPPCLPASLPPCLPAPLPPCLHGSVEPQALRPPAPPARAQRLPPSQDGREQSTLGWLVGAKPKSASEAQLSRGRLREIGATQPDPTPSKYI